MYAMKVNKTLSLSIDVASQLDGEDNQSQLVEELLREYYEIDD